MANRNFRKTLNSFNTELTFIEGNAVIGGTGAVGTVKGSGVKSIVRNSAGNYTLKLEDKYARYLGGHTGFIHTAAGGSGIASVEVADYSVNTHVEDGSGVIIQCFDYAGAKADPASGSVLGFVMYLRNSSLKGKGE